MCNLGEALELEARQEESKRKDEAGDWNFTKHS